MKARRRSSTRSRLAIVPAVEKQIMKALGGG